MATRRLRVPFLSLLVFIVAALSLLPMHTATAQEPEIQYAFTTAAVNGRTEPVIDPRTLIKPYDPGTLLRVVDAGGDWVRVVHDEWTMYPDLPLSGGPVYVNKRYLSFVKPEDVAPIQSDEQRRIVIDLSDQHLWAYLGDELYLETPVSTGREGRLTPTGTFRIFNKRWSQNMQGLDDEGDRRSTPGVSYVQYFTENGMALHGTYWHNNFGQPMSYGCINVPIDAARRLYIFTTPAHTDFQQEMIWGVDAKTVVQIQE